MLSCGSVTRSGLAESGWGAVDAPGRLVRGFQPSPRGLTRRDPTQVPAPDLVDRDFTATAPDQGDKTTESVDRAQRHRVGSLLADPMAFDVLSTTAHPCSQILTSFDILAL